MYAYKCALCLSAEHRKSNKVWTFQTSDTGASVNSNTYNTSRRKRQSGSGAQCKETRPADRRSQPPNKAAISSGLLLKSLLPVWFQQENMASAGSLRRGTEMEKRSEILSERAESSKPQVRVGAGWLGKGQGAPPPSVIALFPLRSHGAGLHDNPAE